MTRTAILVLATVTVVIVSDKASARAYEPFPDYRTVGEVPIVGHFPSKASRRGPRPTRAWVELTKRNLRAMGASKIECHGLPGRLVACRARIAPSVRARVIVRHAKHGAQLIASCQTLSGTLNAAACFDFTVWEFNWTERGL